MYSIYTDYSLTATSSSTPQGIYKQYSDSTDIKLPEWIVITGGWLLVQALVVPDLHYLRQMSIFAAFCSVIFCVVCTGIAAKDGESARDRWRDRWQGQAGRQLFGC